MKDAKNKEFYCMSDIPKAIKSDLKMFKSSCGQ